MTLTVQLGLLEGAGLIQLASVQPELAYIFRHVLVKEAAYHSLVKGDRRSLHRAVGETLERLYSDSAAAARPAPGETYALLAFHFAEAADAARAQRYFTLAGQAAAAAYANTEAAAHFSRALEAAGQVGASAADLIQLHTRLGRVQELSGNYDAALATYAHLEAMGQEHGDQAMVLAALLPQAVIHAVPSAKLDIDLATSLIARALPLARELGDRASEARALWARLLLGLLLGRPPMAVEAGVEALAIARDLGLTELAAVILSDLGRAYTGAGQIEQSRAALDEARELWRGLGNLPMLAENLTDTGGSYLFRGDYQRARALFDESYRVSHSIGNAWGQSYSLMFRGFVMAEIGSLREAIDSLERCLELAVEGGFVAPLVQGRSGLGLIYAKLGQIERAKAEIRAARKVLGDEPSPMLAVVGSMDAQITLLAGDLDAAEALLADARVGFERGDVTTFFGIFFPLADGGLALARGDYARAMSVSAAALAFEREIGLQAFRLDLLLLQARGLIGLSNLNEAAAVLSEARAEAESRRNPQALWAVLAAQGELAERRGDHAQAAQLRRQALDAVETLAAQLTDPALRAGLLNRPEVRALAAAKAADSPPS